MLTTPEGADLPATASEEGFPLLVRLHKDFFDFSQAKANGEDIRFSTGTGTPLAYQIEEWDAADGTASIWVRIPTIKGNARQEIKLYWGKADAASESSGSAVFNESNGYLSVWHMNDPVKDEVGTLESKDTGTTSSCGIIGQSRHFGAGKGINCGENITHLSFRLQPAFFRSVVQGREAECDRPGLGQRAGAGQSGDAVCQSAAHQNGLLLFRRKRGERQHAPHVPMDSRGAHLQERRFADLREWASSTASRTSEGPRWRSRARRRMWIGGWYNNYDFVGDIDEVRISKVARSADWVRLEYENQKPLQTLVGPLVQPGNDVLGLGQDR